MSVSAKEVKKLKDMTDAGLMDCKKALIASEGDIDKAIKFLKEKGLADAKKRGDREANEGGVYVANSAANVGIIQVSCETDFVSGNEMFISSIQDIVNKAVESGNTDVAAYADDIVEVSRKTKENVSIQKLEVISLADNQYAATYIHGKNTIGCVSIFELADASAKDKAEVKEMGVNVSMHIAASSPLYLLANEVPQAELDEQKDIFMKQMADSGKPANVLENIMKGKLTKYCSEICLADQKYVKDDKLSVSNYVEQVGKAIGTDIKLIGFRRFSIGG